MPRTTRSTFTLADAGLFAALSAAWGLSFLFIKVAVGALSPLWVVACRTVIGAVVLLVIMRLRGRRLPTGRPIWGHLLMLATIGNAIPWAMVAAAQRAIPSGMAAVVNSLVPLSTLVIAAVVGLERMSVRRTVGLALAVLGTVIVVSGELGAPGAPAAVVVLAGATLLYGASAVYAKRHVSGRHPPLAVAAGQVLLAALVSVPIAWVVGPMPAWSALDGALIGSVLTLGAAGTGLAFLLFYLLIERVGATNATMVTYVIPVVGVTAGWLVLDERVGLELVLGAAAILVGVWLAQRARIETEQPAPGLGLRT